MTCMLRGSGGTDALQNFETLGPSLRSGGQPRRLSLHGLLSSHVCAGPAELVSGHYGWKRQQNILQRRGSSCGR
jgi:hypothetical protein